MTYRSSKFTLLSTRWFSNHESCLVSRSQNRGFCNLCNVRFDPIPVKVICVNLPKEHSWSSPMKIHYWPFLKNFSQKVNNLKWPLDGLWPKICCCLMCNSTQELLCPNSHSNTSMWIQWLFFKNFTKRSMTPRWSLTLLLLRSHVWLYPRIINCIQVPWKYVQVCGYSDALKKKKNKAVLEPRVLPALRSHTFCNHCIRFENTSKYVDTTPRTR